MENNRKPFIILDDAQNNNARYYKNLICSELLTVNDLPLLDNKLSYGWQRGWHSVLILCYDFGRSLMAITTANYPLRIDWYSDLEFYNDNAIKEKLQLLINDDEKPSIINANFSLDLHQYRQKIKQIHEFIKNGSSYQINFCMQLYLNVIGDPIAFYLILRDLYKSPYGVLAYQNNKDWILGFSPELLIDIKNNQLRCQPMKGTLSNLNHNYKQAQQLLAENDKNRAENTMIVDLMRNDFSKVGRNVWLSDVFAVKSYGSVWQMTSNVHANLYENTKLSTIIKAIFPCGSITGAPKYKTMQLINELEHSKRGLYTGSIGYVEKCANGNLQASFNVAIRTLLLDKKGNGIYGVGSGITIDSDAEEEYKECMWKSHFLLNWQNDFSLFETMLVTNKKIIYLAEHLNRLRQTARELNFKFDELNIVVKINDFLKQNSVSNKNYRLKISLSIDGNLQLQIAEINNLEKHQKVTICAIKATPFDKLRRYKTTRRKLFDNACQQALQIGAFDALIFNEDGYLLEGGRSNVFIKLNGNWYTPCLSLDILNGIMRQQVLSMPQEYLNTDIVTAAKIDLKMLKSAEKIMLSNALRGIFAVDLIS